MITFMTEKDNSFIVSIENPDEEEQEIINKLTEKYRAIQSQKAEKMFSGFRCVRANSISSSSKAKVSDIEEDSFLSDAEQINITEF